MTRRRPLALAALLVAGAAAAPAEEADVVVAAGDGLETRLVEALVLAEPGQVIELPAGTFALSRGLSLTADDVTLRGQGADATVLSFAEQEEGAEGLLVTASGVVLEDLALVDPPGDALKVRGARGVVIRRVRTEWTGGPATENGGYGIYPVDCEDVLVEDCYARGASDAGIYLGQSRNCVIRRCRAEENVAGIEVENSRRVDVHDNVAAKNTGGILVFDLPDLPVKGGGHVRVFRNEVVANQTANFAPEGNIVATVPRGTGILVMANDGVEVFENTVGDHATTNVLVVSYVATGIPVGDPDYDPYPSGVHVFDNDLGACGDAPDGTLGGMAARVGGLPLPDVVWDGVTPRDAGDDAAPVLALHGNGDADVLVLDLRAVMTDPASANPRRGVDEFAGELPRLEPVVLPWEADEAAGGR